MYKALYRKILGGDAAWCLGYAGKPTIIVLTNERVPFLFGFAL
jgi:hypothetical protein